VLTEDNVRDIRTQLEIIPCKSLRSLAQETDILLGSAFTGTGIIHFHPYKITVVLELKQPDCASRICFRNWLLQNVHDGLMDPQLLFVTDEAWN
jgi:hypothetical protein